MCEATRGRFWAFTFNNFSEEEKHTLKEWCERECEKFGFTEEVAPTTGTKHLQGFMGFRNMRQKSALIKKHPKISFHFCKGNEIQNKEYILKSGSNKVEHKNLLNNQDLIKLDMLKEYQDIEWKEWQKDILYIISLGGNDRKINWVYDEQGNSGKSFLRRYICLKHEAILADGKKENIFNAFKVKCIDENKRVKICVMDIPRQNERFVNYGTIESILDRHLYSGKYEGGEIWLDKMTVIIFANFYPDIEYCTKDRWNIITLSE